MDLSRRFLLRGLIAAPAVVAAQHIMKISVLPERFVTPEQFGAIPTVMGDGIHDDSAGINAFFRGEKVETNGLLWWGGENADVVYLGPGIYRAPTLKIPGRYNLRGLSDGISDGMTTIEAGLRDLNIPEERARRLRGRNYYSSRRFTEL